MENRRIASLVWDDWNRAHLQKHGITQSEAEAVVLGDPYVRESYKGRLLATGPNESGRILAVALGPVPGADRVWYVFSARPASRAERARYADWKETSGT